MARTQAYIIGHGSWSPADGFTRVPDGCTISFYTEFGKTLAGDDADRIVAGTLDRKPSRVSDVNTQVPNMKYFPDSPENLKDFEDRKRAGSVLISTTDDDGKDLKGLFAAAQASRDIDYHWAACLAISFKRNSYDTGKHVGSVVTGMNLTEMTDGFYDFEYDKGRYVLIFKK
jgi:hypothetical protein